MEKEFVRKVAEAAASGGIPEGGRVLVALSGGADSVALLRVLLGLGYDCVAAHCNFHLRGDESDRDERFVRGLCCGLAVECVVADFDTAAYVAAHKVSVEMACRELRYRWFEEVRGQYGCAVIAVAHHSDDDVETFFLNLFRGTGIAGLSGIKTRNGNVVRPLLGVGREEIEAYLRELGQDYVVDSTNCENDYARNRIRNVILPAIRECFPAAETAIKATVGNLKGCRQVFRRAIEEYEQTIVDRKAGIVTVARQGLLSSSEPSTVLHEILYPYGFNGCQTSAMLKSLLSGTVGVVYESERYVAEVGRCGVSVIDRAVLDDGGKEWEFSPLSGCGDLPVKIEAELVGYYPGFRFSGGSDAAYFDGRILRERLTLRRWREGDRFRPFGMRGTQKLSDYFSDHKFSLFEKKTAWVLCAGDTIVWLVGHRASSDFTVTEQSRSVLAVRI